MTSDGFNGKKIKIMMAARGFKTQNALAEAANMHPSIISRIINGRYNPTEEEVRKIKAALRWPDEDQARVAFYILAGDGMEVWHGQM